MISIASCETCTKLEQIIELNYENHETRPAAVDALKTLWRNHGSDSAETWSEHGILRCPACGTIHARRGGGCRVRDRAHARFRTPGNLRHRIEQRRWSASNPQDLGFEVGGTMTRLYLSSLLLVGACAADPVSYSAPVGIEMKVKSGDVAQSIVTERKDITTEVGNPYGAFTNDAIAQLGGKQPSRIDLEELTLTLGAQSTGVSTLEQVLTGDVDVALLVNNSNNTYDAGHVTNPTGIGPVEMNPTFDWSTVAPADQTEIIDGSFKVVLRGPAASGFSTLDANAVLQTTFTFTAFQ